MLFINVMLRRYVVHHDLLARSFPQGGTLSDATSSNVSSKLHLLLFQLCFSHHVLKMSSFIWKYTTEIIYCYTISPCNFIFYGSYVAL